jgi:hypothetical protein
VGLRKMRPTVDEDQKLHNPSNVIQIADGGLKTMRAGRKMGLCV